MMVYRNMTNVIPRLTRLSDQELLVEVKALATREREVTTQLIAALVEMDARRLYLCEGCSSLFTYCTQVLRLSEHAAYGRIEAARAARRFPIVLDLLADGSVTLTTVCLLAPHLTPDNHREVLESARHKSKRDVEQLVAALRPQPAVASTVRKLPVPRLAAEAMRAPLPPKSPHHTVPAAPTVAAAPRRSTVVAPLAPELFKIQFTMSREMHQKLRRAQDLLRHVVPAGDPAAIFDRALTLLVSELEKTRTDAATRPRAARPTAPGSRHVPASVKRKVWSRDGGQCAFVGTNGRCVERGFLEYHHVVAYAAGGQTTVENLELRCRSHNAYESELFFGPMIVREAREPWTVSTRSGPS